MVVMLSPNKLTSTQIRSWCVPFSSYPSWFSWTFLMAYSKARFKSNGIKTPPCFRPF